MLFAQIYERTKYAFENDEVYELLMGQKGYEYQAPKYPAWIPTCDEFVFRDGIYPLYRELNPKAQMEMTAKLAQALQKMMRSENTVEVWWALSILYGQKLSETKYKDSPFFIADNLLKEIVPFLLAKKDALKQAHVYMGAGIENGLWEDVLRYDMLLSQKFGIVLLPQQVDAL